MKQECTTAGRDTEPRITIKYAAELLEMSEWAVHCLAKDGALPYAEVGGVWRLSVKGVFDYARAQARESVTVEDLLRESTRISHPDVADALDRGDVGQAARAFIGAMAVAAS